MVQLCLTVHVQKELKDSDGVLSQIDCARFFMRVKSPEKVSLGELANEVENLWNELHPDAE